MARRSNGDFFGNAWGGNARAIPLLGQNQAPTPAQSSAAEERLEKTRTYAQGVVDNYDRLIRYLGPAKAMKALTEAEQSIIRAERNIGS